MARKGRKGNREDSSGTFATKYLMEGKTKNFAALIVQKSNPRLIEIVSEFKETINILTNKPE
jgi:hypothetical protein